MDILCQFVVSEQFHGDEENRAQSLYLPNRGFFRPFSQGPEFPVGCQDGFEILEFQAEQVA